MKSLNLDEDSAHALRKAITYLVICADRQADFLQCLPVTTQDRRLGHVERATRNVLIDQYGIPADAAMVMAHALTKALIFMIAKPRVSITSPGKATDEQGAEE